MNNEIKKAINVCYGILLKKDLTAAQTAALYTLINSVEEKQETENVKFGGF